MKKVLRTIKVFFLQMVIICLLVSCGEVGQENEVNDFLVFWSDREELYSPMATGEMLTMFGGQYYQGEPIQLWCKRIKKGTDSTLEIRKYCQDGSYEVVLSELPEQYFSRNGWYMTEAGEFLVRTETGILKLNQEGKEEIQVALVDTVLDICQVSEKEIVLLLQEATGSVKVAELDLVSGECRKSDVVALGESSIQYITGGEEGVLLLNDEGIWEINLNNGSKKCLLSFSEYHYAFDMLLTDFRLVENDKVEFLQADAKVTLSVLNVTKERTIITMRDYADRSDMTAYINSFNRSNDTYFVIMESGVREKIGAGEYREKTMIELATGEGPDIITADVINNIENLLNKKMLVDLSTYMKRSGIREENYYPAAFSSWKVNDKIYGVEIEAALSGLYIDKKVLGSSEVPDMEILLDKLLAYTEKVVFREYWDSVEVLEYFLRGSENLWGIIDWEEKKCNFDIELFDKMLEVAMRYGAKDDKGYIAIAESRMCDTCYIYDTKAWMESEEKVYLGYYFDDGNHTAQNVYNTIAINANSKNVEGAWEFISFLLSEELQTEMGYESFPVNRNAFENIMARELAIGSIESVERDDGRKGLVYKGYLREGIDPLLYKNKDAYREMFDLNTETVAEINALLEDTRVLPIKTRPILGIIKEEVRALFAGDKSREETIAIIENRVQLYLDE